MLVIFVTAWLVYDVNLPAHLAEWVLITLIACMAAAGLSLLVAAACRTPSQARSLWTVIVLISSVMGNQLSAFLRGIKTASGDFMQGDEDKWQKTYPVSAHAVLIDAVEEDGGVNVSQTSLTVARSNDARLGAVTIGINVDALK